MFIKAELVLLFSLILFITYVKSSPMIENSINNTVVNIMNDDNINYDIENKIILVQKLKKKLKEKENILYNHNIYSKTNNLEQLQIFMENHIYAVWDFMLLVKYLQRKLTSVELIWKPTKYRISRHYINEIILNEESDLINSSYISHFELYKIAMIEINANTSSIDKFINEVTEENYVSIISKLNQGLCNFLFDTFESITEKDLYHNIGYFYYGRENPIPQMFSRIIKNICSNYNCTHMKLYLERHITMDGDIHGPITKIVINELIFDNIDNEINILLGGIHAIESRINFWNYILSLY